MKIYLDTADIGEIEKANEALRAVGSRLDGVTTNPTSASQYAAASGMEPKAIFREIAKRVEGPVSVETIGCSDYDPRHITVEQLLEEAEEIRSWHERFVVKMPCTPEGLAATRQLYGRVPVNMTLVFSVDDALCAAVAGAAYCSPFVGRLDERIPGEGTRIARAIAQLYKERSFATELLFASARTPEHVFSAAAIAAHIVTMPYSVFVQLDPKALVGMQHEQPFVPEKPVDVTKLALLMPRKEEGLARFLSDGEKAGYRIV